MYGAEFQLDNDTEGWCGGGGERNTNLLFVCYAYQERGTSKDCLVSSEVKVSDRVKDKTEALQTEY